MIDLQRATIAAQQGSDLERERLLRHYKPYVINAVGHISKKYVSWSDEEASIGLLALNKAIDTYKYEKGRTFLNYVYLLIKRDLIDFFRKEQRNQLLSLDIEDDVNPHSNYEVIKSMEEYQKKEQSNNLVEEILELNEALSNYQISFEELEKYSPKHKDTRETLTKLADTFCEDEEFVYIFKKKKKLPVTLFSKRTGYKIKTIERYRKYIVTLILLKLHPKWTHLHQYIQKGGNHDG